jgi:hypothetical protein
MNEDNDAEFESRRNRRTQNARPTSPRARSARQKKKSATPGFGGAHRRRNKHWNW